MGDPANDVTGPVILPDYGSSPGKPDGGPDSKPDGGQTSGGQTSGDQTSGGQTSGGQNSGGQNSGGQNSGGQNSDDKTSGGQNSGNQNSGGQYSGGQNSGAEKSGAEKSSGQNASGQGSGTGESRGHWDVDLERLQGFAVAVSAARTGLGAVQTLVSQMQGEAYTPKLGTSPVGQQLARKFDDRLNSDAGLRTLLAEAVRRMDEFIRSAETVRDAYAESEAEAEALMRQAGQG